MEPHTKHDGVTLIDRIHKVVLDSNVRKAVWDHYTPPAIVAGERTVQVSEGAAIVSPIIGQPDNTRCLGY